MASPEDTGPTVQLSSTLGSRQEGLVTVTHRAPVGLRSPGAPGSRSNLAPGEMGSHGKARKDFQVFSDARSQHSMGPPAGIRPYCPLRHGDLSRWEAPGLALTNTLRPGPPRACHALASARGVQGLSSGQLPSA